jgi:anti-sigma regulatory factor (Ser/Thr protein kinase)
MGEVPSQRYACHAETWVSGRLEKVSTAVAESAWCVVVPHHARGARQARHRLTAALTGSIPPALLADVISVAAELIANAVRHAEPLPGGVVRLAWRLRTSEDSRWVEVRVTETGAASRSWRRSPIGGVSTRTAWANLSGLN